MPNRASLLAEVDSILHQSTFSHEQGARAKMLLELADSLTDKSDLQRGREIHRAETTRRHDVQLGRAPHVPPSPPDADFLAYLRVPDSGMARVILARHRDALRIQGAQTVGTTTAGGYLVPQSFADRVEVMLAQADPLFDAATLFETSTGSATGFPILSDEGNVGAVVAEGTSSAIDDLDFTFATLAFGRCPLWRTGLITISMELVNDAAVDVEAVLAEGFATRIARGVGATFITTLLGSATVGLTAASTSAITSDEIFSLVDSVDEAYSAAPGASFCMKRSTLTALLKLKGTGSGNYVFEAERDASGRPLLLGWPVVISPSMGTMSAGGKPISFGDHSKFIRRQVRNSMQLVTLVERFAEFGKMAYELHLRVDGDLAKSASTCPVKYLQMHA